MEKRRILTVKDLVNSLINSDPNAIVVRNTGPDSFTPLADVYNVTIIGGMCGFNTATTNSNYNQKALSLVFYSTD